MAFPVIAATNTTADTDASPTTVAMPSGIVAGNLLIVICSADVGDTITQSGGSDWTKLEQTNQAGVIGLVIFAKLAVGSDTLTLTSTGSNDIACVSMRITGHSVSNVSTGIKRGTAATGTNAAPNPPNLAPGTARDWLFIECFAADDDDNTTPYESTNYTAVAQIESASSTTSSLCAVASRNLNGTSDNPGVMAMAATEEWVAQTIAIPPVFADIMTDNIVGTDIMKIGKRLRQIDSLVLSETIKLPSKNIINNQNVNYIEALFVVKAKNVSDAIGFTDVILAIAKTHRLIDSLSLSENIRTGKGILVNGLFNFSESIITLKSMIKQDYFYISPTQYVEQNVNGPYARTMTQGNIFLSRVQGLVPGSVLQSYKVYNPDNIFNSFIAGCVYNESDVDDNADVLLWNGSAIELSPLSYGIVSIPADTVIVPVNGILYIGGQPSSINRKLNFNTELEPKFVSYYKSGGTVGVFPNPFNGDSQNDLGLSLYDITFITANGEKIIINKRFNFIDNLSFNNSLRIIKNIILLDLFRMKLKFVDGTIVHVGSFVGGGGFIDANQVRKHISSNPASGSEFTVVTDDVIFAISAPFNTDDASHNAGSVIWGLYEGDTLLAKTEVKSVPDASGIVTIKFLLENGGYIAPSNKTLKALPRSNATVVLDYGGPVGFPSVTGYHNAALGTFPELPNTFVQGGTSSGTGFGYDIVFGKESVTTGKGVLVNQQMSLSDSLLNVKNVLISQLLIYVDNLLVSKVMLFLNNLNFVDSVRIIKNMIVTEFLAFSEFKIINKNVLQLQSLLMSDNIKKLGSNLLLDSIKFEEGKKGNWRPNPNDNTSVAISTDRIETIAYSSYPAGWKIKEILFKFNARGNVTNVLMGIYDSANNLMYSSVLINPSTFFSSNDAVMDISAANLVVPIDGIVKVAFYQQAGSHSVRRDSTNPTVTTNLRSTSVMGIISTLPASLPAMSSISSNDYNIGLGLINPTIIGKSFSVTQILSFSENLKTIKNIIKTDINNYTDSIQTGKGILFNQILSLSKSLHTNKNIIITQVTSFIDDIKSIANKKVNDIINFNEQLLTTFGNKNWIMTEIFNSMESIKINKNFRIFNIASFNDIVKLSKNFIISNNLSFTDTIDKVKLEIIGRIKTIIVRNKIKPKFIRNNVNTKIIRNTINSTVLRKIIKSIIFRNKLKSKMED